MDRALGSENEGFFSGIKCQESTPSTCPNRRSAKGGRQAFDTYLLPNQPQYGRYGGCVMLREPNVGVEAAEAGGFGNAHFGETPVSRGRSSCPTAPRSGNRGRALPKPRLITRGD